MAKARKPQPNTNRGKLETWKAVAACKVLVNAYRRGEVNEHMDWNDVDDAYKIACEALSVQP